MIQFVLFSMTVCLDLFFTVMAYTMSGIRIPWASAAILSGTGAIFFMLSGCLGKTLWIIFPWWLWKGISVGLLGGMGVLTLYKEFGKRRQQQRTPPTLGTVFFSAEAADADASKELSVREAFLLAAALSIDSVAVGVSCGDVQPLWSGGITLLTGSVAYLGGRWCGRKFPKKKGWDWSWCGGILLLCMAGMRLFWK